jgi:phosphopantetheinyl transferase
MRMNRVILAYSRLHGQLPAAVRSRWRARLTPAHALRLSTDARAQSRTLLGVALACRLLSAAGGRRFEPHELRYSRHGRPHAPGLPDFSVAHAGAWVVCALASGGAVGVDIEPLVSRASLPGWQGAFDAEEQAAARSPRRALAIWTAKEAALKAAGATLAELAQVRVRGRRVEFRGRSWYCRAPQLAPGTVTRVVTAQPVTRLLREAVPASLVLAQ